MTDTQRKASSRRDGAFLIFGTLLALGAGGARAAAPSPEWLALLHFDVAGRAAGTLDPDFYLQAVGAAGPDPALERELALDAFFTRRDLAVTCRFPARYALLREETGRDGEPPPEELCPALAGAAPARVSLAFASAYAGHAASMFGHVFLLLETPDGGRLFAASVDFSAQMPGGEAGIGLAFRGLSGGYRGRYNTQPLYERVRRYAYLQNRDLWFYVLDFDAAERAQLARHLWELRDIDFRYTFAAQNCGRRTLELVDAARGSALRAGFNPFTTAPTEVLTLLDGAGLLTPVALQFATPGHLAALDARLAPDERAVVRAALDAGASPDAAWLAAHPTAARLLYEHARDRAQRVAADPGTLDRLSPYAGPSLATRTVDADEPHPARVQPYRKFEFGRLGQPGRDAARLGYSIGYHGLTDLVSGHQPGYGVEALRVVARVDADRVVFDRLALVALDNLPSYSYHSPRPASRFHAGVLRSEDPADRVASTYVRLDLSFGLAARRGGFSAGAFAAGETRSTLSGRNADGIGLGPELVLLWQGGRGTALVEARRLWGPGQDARAARGEFAYYPEPSFGLVLGGEARDGEPAVRELFLSVRVHF